jgi:hypothetical protein
MTGGLKLTNGMVCLVDDDWYEVLRSVNWYAAVRKTSTYAYRNTRYHGVMTCELLHRLIMRPDPGLGVDHINGNGLDNRRENLRICSQALNARNLRISPRGTSRYKGVYWSTQYGKWEAKITLNYKCKYLGRYEAESDAAAAYNRAAVDAFGEFAQLNILGGRHG